MHDFYENSGSKRNIAVVTGSRAEYGLYKSTLEAIRHSSELQLRLIVCGTHLVKNLV